MTICTYHTSKLDIVILFQISHPLLASHPPLPRSRVVSLYIFPDLIRRAHLATPSVRTEPWIVQHTSSPVNLVSIEDESGFEIRNSEATPYAWAKLVTRRKSSLTLGCYDCRKTSSPFYPQQPATAGFRLSLHLYSHEYFIITVVWSGLGWVALSARHPIGLLLRSTLCSFHLYVRHHSGVISEARGGRQGWHMHTVSPPNLHPAQPCSLHCSRIYTSESHSFGSNLMPANLEYMMHYYYLTHNAHAVQLLDDD